MESKTNVPPAKAAVRKRLWIIIALAVLVSACAFLRIYTPLDLINYGKMCWSCPAVWRDLALRRIRPGHSLERVRRVREPTQIRTYGRYQLLSYTDDRLLAGTGIVLKDGRVCNATVGNKDWIYRFFDTRTDKNRKDFEDEVYRYDELSDRERARLNGR